MADWFYRVGDRSFGPISNTELLDLVRVGTVDGDTQVRKDDSNWVLAHSVGGLLDAARRDETATVCPYCGEPIAQPPTRCDNCQRNVKVVMRGSDNEKIYRQAKSISDELNLHEEALPEKEETAQSHFLIVLVAVMFLISLPLAIYLWFNFHRPLVVQLAGTLLTVFAVVGGYAYYLATKTNNKRNF